MPRASNEKKPLKDAILECVQADPSIAHSPWAIAEHVGANVSAVKEQLSQMERKSLMNEIESIPESEEKRQILSAIKNLHLRCDEVLTMITERAKQSDASPLDISTFVRVSDHSLKILMCRMQALVQEVKKNHFSIDNVNARRVPKASDMKPQFPPPKNIPC